MTFIFRGTCDPFSCLHSNTPLKMVGIVRPICDPSAWEAEGRKIATSQRPACTTEGETTQQDPVSKQRLEKWLKGEKLLLLLLLQRTGVHFLATTQWFTATHNSSSKESDAGFLPLKAPSPHAVHRHIYMQPKYPCS